MSRWLKRTLPDSNETLQLYLGELVRQARQASGSEADRAWRTVRIQLVGVTPNADHAAAALGVHRRTLGRRLSASLDAAEARALDALPKLKALIDEACEQLAETSRGSVERRATAAA